MTAVWHLLILLSARLVSCQDLNTPYPSSEPQIVTEPEMVTEPEEWDVSTTSSPEEVEECRDLVTGETYQVGDSWYNNVTCWLNTCDMVAGRVYYYITTCPVFYTPPDRTDCSLETGQDPSYPACCPTPTCDN